MAPTSTWAHLTESRLATRIFSKMFWVGKDCWSNFAELLVNRREALAVVNEGICDAEKDDPYVDGVAAGGIGGIGDFTENEPPWKQTGKHINGSSTTSTRISCRTLSSIITQQLGKTFFLISFPLCHIY